MMARPVRIGIIDFDTSHAVAFVSRLNHVGIEESQWVDGARVVVGCPGKSLLFPERIAQETAKVAKLGLELVNTPEAMLKYRLDAVFVESNSGFAHLERARFFLGHKLPLFVDKPFACTSADARQMFALAEAAGVPIFSSSSLRYAPKVVAFKSSAAASNQNLGCITYGPAPTHERNPGLFHYGIHAVEMLFAIMGRGCQWLSNVSSARADVVSGHWADGRIGTVRGERPSGGYAFSTSVDGNVGHHQVTTRDLYQELLKQIIRMLQTGRAPVPAEETLEIVRFIEQAADSAANHGNPRLMCG